MESIVAKNPTAILIAGQSPRDLSVERDRPECRASPFGPSHGWERDISNQNPQTQALGHPTDAPPASIKCAWLTTDSTYKFNIAPYLRDSNFTADQSNQKGTGDISYVWTRERWRYSNTSTAAIIRAEGVQHWHGRALTRSNASGSIETLGPLLNPASISFLKQSRTKSKDQETGAKLRSGISCTV